MSVEVCIERELVTDEPLDIQLTNGTREYIEPGFKYIAHTIAVIPADGKVFTCLREDCTCLREEYIDKCDLEEFYMKCQSSDDEEFRYLAGRLEPYTRDFKNDSVYFKFREG